MPAVSRKAADRTHARPAPARWVRSDLWWLAGLALLLRLTFLWLGTREQSLADMSMWANDTRNYLSAASFWLSGDPAGAQAMLLAGPGYALLLAVFQILFAGAVLWPALVLNLLFGCAAPVVLYVLASELTGRRTVALGAGLISAVSVTSPESAVPAIGQKFGVEKPWPKAMPTAL